MSKEILKAVRLLTGAAEAEADSSTIAPEYIQQIADARAKIATTRGTDVISAVVTLRRSGLPLALDVRLRTLNMGKEQSKRPAKH